MKKYFIIVFVTIIVFVVAATIYSIFFQTEATEIVEESNAKIEPPIIVSVKNSENCTFSEWVVQEEGYSNETIVSLANSLSAATEVYAKSDSIISIVANGKLASSFENLVKNTAKKSVYRKASVSQEFYQQCIAYCIIITNLERQIKEGIYSNEKQLTEAREILLEISKNFAGIAKSEKAKITTIQKKQTRNIIVKGCLECKVKINNSLTWLSDRSFEVNSDYKLSSVVYFLGEIPKSTQNFQTYEFNTSDFVIEYKED